MVETNYQNNLNEIDSKASFNPLFDCEPEIIVDESVCVKTEIDRLDPCVPDYYVPSTSDWDNSNRQKYIFKDGANSRVHEEIVNRNKSIVAHQKSPSKRKRESAIQSLHRKRKKFFKTKSTSSESKQCTISWQLPSNIEKIM